ncbi:tetratricopeptide repeat protein [Gaoshiqia sediminis]|uniref:Tetratricopeptide repeat protein n=1 Tax=Gaoshiqia sediminis TaxID=2986998 RepID=A0AA42C5D0_9BACT|nr:tetratricopeptide repeat protein [Gaoshiqia sediminis]MCW0481429.1 tetratricopeptide repeat protein [Gaoshiqia sediminis]
MKTRLLLFIALTCCTALSALAQQTAYYESLSEAIHQAKELYEKNKFIAAQEQFAGIAARSEANSATRSEAEFYQALCALKLESGNSKEQMENFLARTPESPYANLGLFELGNARFNSGQYALMLRSWKNLKTAQLTNEEQEKVIYQRGYAYFQTEQYALAEKEFARIKDRNSRLAAPAKYYWAHIAYLNERYDEALATFNQLKDNPAFAPVIPFYMSQIYYKQGEYARVIEFTEPLLKTADKQQLASLSKILANSYFHLQRYPEAIPHFETYFAESKSRQRDENYMLGYCYYVAGRYPEAIAPLEHASKGKDELAQNAYYHLADCYVKTDDKNKARVAFEAASEMDFNPDIKEDALFNFAKITYELSYSPFNETIRAFDKYISLYPNSGRNDAAYDYLVKVYMSTSNYKDAVESIEKIKVKSPAIRKAWQRVTYFRGLELFNNLDYQSAIGYFDQSLANAEQNRELQASALFWKAEAAYRLGDYNQAVAGFNQFLKTPGATSLPEYQSANYNLGYSFFKLKDYNQAAAAFQKYTTGQTGDRGDKLGDAYNRLGDCYFINRDYRNAVKNYEQAYALRTYDADYALFQKAICLGLQREQEQKTSSLRSLLQTFPQSAFTDDALYELGRTYERQNENQIAIGYYNDLLKEHSQSSFQAKALLQLGLIYYNQSNYNQSLDYYKQVVEKYPNSPEAQSALLGIKNNYVEMNNVDAYFAYVNRIGQGATVTVSEQDSLSYLAAEKLVMDRNPQARLQLERYLQQYPEGSFSLNARFYLGESKYASGEFSSALKDFEYVAGKPDNIFTEPALGRAAELEFNAANYSRALTYYERMDNISNTKWNQLRARAGKMRCHYELANYTACLEASQQLLETENLTEELKREANYKLAKSLYLTQNYTQALPLFTELAKDTKSHEGAESKYLLTEILASQNQLNQAENEVMDFISKNTPHQFWLAKSFILLADIYLQKGDDFQAKHTLKSIVENYPEENDGILETAGAKLKHLEDLEKQQQQQQDKPMEININQQ